MALQEEKGIEVDYWYLKSSSMSSPWFRNMWAIEDIGNLCCHETDHQMKEAPAESSRVLKGLINNLIWTPPRGPLMIMILFFLVKWEIVQAAWGRFRLTWWFTSISLFNSLRVLEGFAAPAKVMRPDPTNRFGVVFFSRWKRRLSQDGTYVFCLIHEKCQCKKGVGQKQIVLS
jgi:hypothetical protein